MKGRLMSPHKARPSGAAMLAAMFFVMASSVVVAAWLTLRVGRVRQALALDDAVQRSISWGNNRAINVQNNYVNYFSESGTYPASTGTYGSNWGGVLFQERSVSSPFRSQDRDSSSSVRYMFRNLDIARTADNSVFFNRADSTSDSQQTEHVSLYNYLKTYPAPLLGDLFILHKRPTGATGTMSFSKAIHVDGRVVINEADAQTENLRALSCACMGPKVIRTVTNAAGSGLVMPENFSATARCTAGNTSVAGSSAHTDGTLDMIDNPDFPLGSLKSIAESKGTFQTYEGPVTGLLGIVTGLLGGVVGGLVDLTSLSSSFTDPVQIQRTTLSALQLTGVVGSDLTSVIPLYNGYTGLLNIGIIVANHPNLTSVKMTGTLDLVIILGQLLPFGLSNTASLPPVIIWVDQASKPRHVIFVGESQRPIVFATGTGTGKDTYVGFVGVTALLGGPLQWRLHWVNEYTHLIIVPPLLFGYLDMTGSMRTNWSIDTTELLGIDRVYIHRDTDQVGMEGFLPRDAWLETYTMIR